MTDEARDVGVVIVAGGSSTRTTGRRVEAVSLGRRQTALLHSVQTFMARTDVVGVVVALPREYAADPPPWLFQWIRPPDDFHWRTHAHESRCTTASRICPTKRRSCSCTTPRGRSSATATIDRVVQSARGGVCAIAALPVVDTLKEVAADGAIVRTVDREHLWRAQTPQGFPRAVIVRAHRHAQSAGPSATDDAALCEALGERVRVVRGSERAMKITE